MEASIAPKNVLRLATSEIKAMRIAEISTFIKLYVKIYMSTVK